MFRRRKDRRQPDLESPNDKVFLRVRDMRELDDTLVSQIHNILRLNPDSNIVIRVDAAAYNRGYLATSQDDIDYTKLERAQRAVVDGRVSFTGDEIDPPRGFLSKREKKDGYYLVLGDGNHRVAIGLYYGVPVDVKVVLPPLEKIQAWGFNKLHAPIKHVLQSMGE